MATTEATVKFWCFQALVDMVNTQKRYVTLSEQQKASMRNALVAWAHSKGGPQVASTAFTFVGCLPWAHLCGPAPREWSRLMGGRSMKTMYGKAYATICGMRGP